MSTDPASRHRIHSYCSTYNWTVPDYTAIKSANYSTNLMEGNYWLSNFRDQYFSTSS